MCNRSPSRWAPISITVAATAAHDVEQTATGNLKE